MTNLKNLVKQFGRNHHFRIASSRSGFTGYRVGEMLGYSHCQEPHQERAVLQINCGKDLRFNAIGTRKPLGSISINLAIAPQALDYIVDEVETAPHFKYKDPLLATFASISHIRPRAYRMPLMITLFEAKPKDLIDIWETLYGITDCFK